MELNWLEDYLALIDFRHFGQAAEKRNISQPAFSRRIRMLEQWLGVPLFTRDTHRIDLTLAGELFKPVAEDVLRNILLGREQAREAARGTSSSLRFASTHALSIMFFPQWLQSIEAVHPLESTISLVTDNMAGCERLMLLGEAHFLLCHHHAATPIPFRPDYFISLDIGADTLIPVSAPRFAGSDEPMFALPGRNDAQVPYLSYSDVSGMGRILASAHALDGPSTWLTPVFTSHVATVLATMARDGRGLAWLPASMIARDLEFKVLVRAGDNRWDVPIDVRLYRSRARQSPMAEKFWLQLKRSPQVGPQDGMTSILEDT